MILTFVEWRKVFALSEPLQHFLFARAAFTADDVNEIFLQGNLTTVFAVDGPGMPLTKLLTKPFLDHSKSLDSKSFYSF